MDTQKITKKEKKLKILMKLVKRIKTLHPFCNVNKAFWLKTNVPNFCLYATVLNEQWCCCFQKFFSNFLTKHTDDIHERFSQSKQGFN